MAGGKRKKPYEGFLDKKSLDWLLRKSGPRSMPAHEPEIKPEDLRKPEHARDDQVKDAPGESDPLFEDTALPESGSQAENEGALVEEPVESHFPELDEDIDDLAAERDEDSDGGDGGPLALDGARVPGGFADKLRTAVLVMLSLVIIALLLLGGYMFVAEKNISGSFHVKQTQDAPAPQVKHDRTPFSEDFTELKMYYPTSTGLQLENRHVERVSTIKDVARATVEEFLSGPSGNVRSLMPENASLLGVYNGIDGVLYLDFSESFKRGFQGDTMAELTLLNALYDSVMANVYGISGLHVLIEGREVDSIGGHISLQAALDHMDEYSIRQQGIAGDGALANSTSIGNTPGNTPGAEGDSNKAPQDAESTVAPGAPGTGGVGK